jgi:hypothetical protein
MGAGKPGLTICPQASIRGGSTLDTRVRIRRDDRDEERAVVNLPADLPVPGFSAAQLALVEPNLDSAGAKCLANPLRRLRIL